MKLKINIDNITLTSRKLIDTADIGYAKCYRYSMVCLHGDVTITMTASYYDDSDGENQFLGIENLKAVNHLDEIKFSFFQKWNLKRRMIKILKQWNKHGIK